MDANYSLSVFSRIYSCNNWGHCEQENLECNIEVGYWTTYKLIFHYSLCRKLEWWRPFYLNKCMFFFIENSIVLLLLSHSSTDTPKHHLNWGMCCILTPTAHCSPFNKHPCAWQNLITWCLPLVFHREIMITLEFLNIISIKYLFSWMCG